MSKYAIMPLEDYSILCDTLRNTLQTEEKITSTDIGAYIPACVDVGRKAECDEFWDYYQDYGKRAHYRYAFYRLYWNDQNFKPKYDIVPSQDGQYVFQQSGITDLKGILERQGVKLDFSKTPNLYHCFNSSSVTRLPIIDGSNCTNWQNFVVACASLVSIDKIIVSDKVVASGFTAAFNSCRSLTDVVFEGVIAASIDFSYSPLSVASMKSIISCLKDFSGTASEFSTTLTFSGDCWAALEADSTSPTGSTWEEYVFSLGWDT